MRRLTGFSSLTKRKLIAALSLCGAVMFIFLTPGARILAQTASTGALSGTVTDSSGAVISGATVTITSEATGEVRHQSTGSDGTFLAPLLLPGTYKVEVANTGFKTLVRPGVPVFVTEKKDLHLVLEVGVPTQTIQVEMQGELLKTEDAALGNVTEGQAVSELPLTNRNFTQIIGLSPGVIADVNNASDLGRGNTGLSSTDGGFSSHGGATNDNNYQMNGSQVNDLMAAGNFSGGVPIPNPDAIQEFKVQTGQYDATYGRNAGANVNLVTKSGTNEVHGTVFEFVRNDIFNANDYFLNRQGKAKASLKQNQFGFTLGGPIIKNKLFAFGSYQGTRQINGLDNNCLSTFTTPPQLAGLPDRSRTSLGAAFANQTSTLGTTVAPDGSNLSQEAINLLNLKLSDGSYLIPSPQNTTTGQSTVTRNCFYNADQFLTDIDYNQSDRSKLTGRFFFENDKQNATLPQGFGPMLPGFNQPINTSFRNLSLTHTYTFNSRLLNQVVLAYNRLNNLLVQDEPMVQGPSGSVPFSYSAIGATAPGFDDQYPGIGIIGAFALGGNGQGTSLIQNQYNLDDTVSYTRGRHSFRFGGGLSRQQINFENFHFLGLSAFLSPADLVLGEVVESEDFVGVPDRAWRAWNGHLYAQDDFKATNRLTLNLGLRYERQGLIGDALGRASIFDTTRANPEPPVTGSLQGYVVASNFKGTLPDGVVRASNDAALNGNGQNEWAPRVGFSWMLPRTDRFVLRGGYGLFYTRSTGQPFLQLLANPPYGLIRLQLFQPLSAPFPAAPAQFPYFNPYCPPSSNQPPCVGQPPLTPTTFAANFRPPIVQEFSLNLQSEVMRGLVLEVGYEGARGTHLIQQRLFNQALPASSSNPVHGETQTLFTNIANRVPIWGFAADGATIIDSKGASWYNALNASLKKQFRHGLTFLASYTWDRSLTADNNYSTGPNGGLPVGDQNDPHQRYGPDGFVRPQRFVLSYQYDLPSPGNRTSLKGRVLAGWSVAGVTTIQAGQFMTITQQNVTNAFGIDVPGLDRPQFAAGCTNSQLATHGAVTDRLDNFLNLNCITGSPVITADGIGTAFGNIDVGAVRGPDQRNFDIVAIKKTQLTERMGLEFRAEFFNAFNTPQFANPSNLDAGISLAGSFIPDPNATFGKITLTNVNPRLIQLAMKLNF